MRIVTATICALALAGCASELPYTIAIGDPSDKEIGPDHTKCVLRLDKIVKAVADNYSTSKLADIKSLQVEFEKQLRHSTQTEVGPPPKEKEEETRFLNGPPPLENCEDGKQEHEKGIFSSFKKGDYPFIEEISKKWLTSYALDATDPDQSIDRFREYLRSAQLVQDLAKQPLPPADKEFSWVENKIQPQSQWCGGLTPDIEQTDQSRQPQTPAQTEEELKKAKDCRSLYHVETQFTALAFHEDGLLPNLYKHLLAEIEEVKTNGTQRNRRYFMLGYEIPWDKDRTLVRYGVTFYFGQTAPEVGEAYSEEKHAVQLIGYDLTYANEATPKPFVERETEETPKCWEKTEKVKSPWCEHPWRITGYPFSLVIGLKNAAFEIAKLPFSTIAGLLFGRDALNYPIANFQTAYNAFYVEAFTQTHRGAEVGLYRLLTEIPLVGQLFQYNSGGDRMERDELPSDIRRKIFLSRGIYGGNKWGQDTGLWALFARQSYPDTYDVYSPPYRHGTVIDVVWSMFNLSHGPAYSEAKYVMEQSSREDRLYLAGHSGGVQRSAAASRILFHHGYKVIKVVGIAGPSIGQAIVDRRYPEAFKVYLNTGSGANQDVTSKVGNVAGAFSTLLDYAVIVPLKYTLGSLGGLVIWNREGAYRVADRFGFSNATIVEVERKPSSRHQTPMRLSFSDRLVFDAYIRNEFSTAFREDLERADRPHKVDRPHAFPWEP